MLKHHLSQDYYLYHALSLVIEDTKLCLNCRLCFESLESSCAVPLLLGLRTTYELRPFRLRRALCLPHTPHHPHACLRVSTWFQASSPPACEQGVGRPLTQSFASLSKENISCISIPVSKIRADYQSLYQVVVLSYHSRALSNNTKSSAMHWEHGHIQQNRGTG